MKAGHYDAVVGLGGGKIIDCRQVRRGTHRPATGRRTDEPRATTACARPSPPSTTTRAADPYGVPNPIAVVIDLDVIREAPARFVRAGIGRRDLNINSIADWETVQTASTARRSTAWPPPWPGRPAKAVLRHRAA